MIKLKKIKLINFCGYKNFELDLENNNIDQWLILFGTNGCGKSNFLSAIQYLSYPWSLSSRPDCTMFFRKLTFHKDYLPGFEAYEKNKNNMHIEAVFNIDNKDKRVVIKNNWIPEESGIVINELKSIKPMSTYIDADHPINMQKFQLKSKYKDEFLDFAEDVYGFKCELLDSSLVEEYDSVEDEYLYFYTDFIITKFNDVKVHFKRMSDGEKKIATMLRMLFNDCYKENNRILLIDNIVMHIYFKRHMKLINKFNEYFSDHQIIATTHSPVIINEFDKKNLLNIEESMKEFKK